MHVISFEVHEPVEDGVEWFALHILIDGRDLREYVREVELPFATAEGHPQVAGKYAGIAARWLDAPKRYLLDESDAGYVEDGRVMVLWCECGEPGCWPLLARIDVGATTVRWSDFVNPHRSADTTGAIEGRMTAWQYDDLGPFTFERRQYEAALEAAVREHRRIAYP
jgi:hypothetical protein